MGQLTRQRNETHAAGSKCNCDNVELKLQDLFGRPLSQTGGWGGGCFHEIFLNLPPSRLPLLPTIYGLNLRPKTKDPEFFFVTFLDLFRQSGNSWGSSVGIATSYRLGGRS
jgi:hypothetical protein